MKSLCFEFIQEMKGDEYSKQLNLNKHLSFSIDNHID